MRLAIGSPPPCARMRPPTHRKNTTHFSFEKKKGNRRLKAKNKNKVNGRLTFARILCVISFDGLLHLSGHKGQPVRFGMCIQSQADNSGNFLLVFYFFFLVERWTFKKKKKKKKNRPLWIWCQGRAGICPTSFFLLQRALGCAWAFLFFVCVLRIQLRKGYTTGHSYCVTVQAHTRMRIL